MTLEDILKTTKAVIATAKEDLWDRPDEWIRKQYEKRGDRIPDKYFDELVCGLSVLGPSIAFASTFHLFPEVRMLMKNYKVLRFIPLIAALSCCYQDATYSAKIITGHLPSPKTTTETPSPLASYYNNYNKMVRPYLVAASTILFGLTGIKLYDHFMLGQSYAIIAKEEPLLFYQASFCAALGFLASASSMYLKDRTPRQFKKDPFWKRAYDSLKEKVTEMMPEPLPVPIPVDRYNAVEPTH